MNLREGVRRLYFVLCALACLLIAGGGIAVMPAEESIRYAAADRVLDAAKDVGLTVGDGRRYGSYSGWSPGAIYATFCPRDKTIGPMLLTCEENRVTSKTVLAEQGKFVAQLICVLVAFLFAAAIVMHTGAWIANGFTSRDPRK